MTAARHSDEPEQPDHGELGPDDLEQVAGGEDESDAPNYPPVHPDPWAGS